jgi:hypothetical protein
MIHQEDLEDEYPSWDDRWNSISRDRSEVRDEEYSLEKRVSKYIRRQPFLWINVDDKPSKNSERARLEQNIIALLSNFDKEAVDPRSKDWLGNDSPKKEIRKSGLWNVNHVGENYSSDFLKLLEKKVGQTTNEP